MLLCNSLLEEIVESAMYATFTNPGGLPCLPMGLMLVSASGLGKSKTVFQYVQEPMVHRSDSLTSSGILSILEKDLENQVKFILHGDFNEVLSHKQSVVALTSATLLSAMSDGLVSVDDGRTNKKVKHEPVGVITALTRDMYIRNEKKWAALGLSRRFLFIFYAHSRPTKEKIQTAINESEQANVPSIQKLLEHFPPKEKANIYIPKEFSDRIQAYSEELSRIRSAYPAFVRDRNGNGKMKSLLREEEAPYTTHHMLRALACGHSLKNKRAVQISVEDVDFIRDILDFCKWDRPKEI